MSETKNATIRITSDYWLEQVRENPAKSFFIQWRNIIMGCCSVYKGAAAYLGLPESEEGYEEYAIEGDGGMTCRIHRDVLENWRKMGPMPEGDYLFTVQTVGRFRLAFSKSPFESTPEGA